MGNKKWRPPVVTATMHSPTARFAAPQIEKDINDFPKLTVSRTGSSLHWLFSSVGCLALCLEGLKGLCMQKPCKNFTSLDRRFPPYAIDALLVADDLVRIWPHIVCIETNSYR